MATWVCEATSADDMLQRFAQSLKADQTRASRPISKKIADQYLKWLGLCSVDPKAKCSSTQPCEHKAIRDRIYELVQDLPLKNDGWRGWEPSTELIDAYKETLGTCAKQAIHKFCSWMTTPVVPRAQAYPLGRIVPRDKAEVEAEAEAQAVEPPPPVVGLTRHTVEYRSCPYTGGESLFYPSGLLEQQWRVQCISCKSDGNMTAVTWRVSSVDGPAEALVRANIPPGGAEPAEKAAARIQELAQAKADGIGMANFRAMYSMFEVLKPTCSACDKFLELCDHSRAALMTVIDPVADAAHQAALQHARQAAKSAQEQAQAAQMQRALQLTSDAGVSLAEYQRLGLAIELERAAAVRLLRRIRERPDGLRMLSELLPEKKRKR